MTATTPLTEDQERMLIETAREAARLHIMPRFRQLDADAVTAKSAADDLVTIADQEAERHMAAAIAAALPGARIVGEEAAEDDPSLVGQLAEAPLAVIIDPVDGTWNFAHGLATFGVILAVTVRGAPVFGLLYDPVLDDWVLARKGGGAWFCRPGAAPRRLTMPAQPSPATGGFLPLRLFPAVAQARLASELITGTRTNALGCACHEYRMMAMGHGRYMFGVGPKPWDHAAGTLAVTEAGGMVAMLDGSPYDPSSRKGVLLSAQSPAIFAELQTGLGWLSEGEA